MEQEPILAWHCCGPTLRDGRPIPPDGEWLVHEGAAMLCFRGLHASERLIDALHYAPGTTICRVVLEDVVERAYDKLVARRRKILWRIENADDLLRAFAREVALSEVDLWGCPAIVREYLEKAIRTAARVTARVTARAATIGGPGPAAGTAAGTAARAATMNAAMNAAMAAAMDAAMAVALDAGRPVTLAEFNEMLERHLMEAHKP